LGGFGLAQPALLSFFGAGGADFGPVTPPTSRRLPVGAAEHMMV